MPSTLILGSPAGPDGAGGAFQNTVEADRAALWDALGGAQGVIRGFGFAGVAGQMALEIDANSSALVGERAQDGTASLKRGYHVYTPGSSTTLISFDPASASGRNDAVVAAFVDTEDGALGTGVSQAGPQVVVVTGVSGVTVPRTDTEINDWIGRGGWVRLFDVPIASTDTEINVANVTTTPATPPETGRKRAASDQAVNNTTTVVNDSELSFEAEPNESYLVQVGAIFHPGGSSSLMDAKVGFGVPSGSWSGGAIRNAEDMPGGEIEGEANLTAWVGAVAQTLRGGLSNSGGTTLNMWTINVVVNVGATGGTVHFRWAQGTAVAFDLTRKANSWVRWEKF